jgi:hypothetical protein
MTSHSLVGGYDVSKAHNVVLTCTLKIEDGKCLPVCTMKPRDDKNAM